MKSTVKIFRGKKGWYWRMRAANGRIVAIGAEPFASKGNAKRSFLGLVNQILDGLWDWA